MPLSPVNAIVKSETPRVFFYHYNKPASKSAGKPQISIHYKDTCYIVDNIVVNCRCYGHVNKRQPYFVMKGKTKRIEIEDRVATIF